MERTPGFVLSNRDLNISKPDLKHPTSFSTSLIGLGTIRTKKRTWLTRMCQDNGDHAVILQSNSREKDRLLGNSTAGP
jgi:hypothetical protein